MSSRPEITTSGNREEPLAAARKELLAIATSIEEQVRRLGELAKRFSGVELEDAMVNDHLPYSVEYVTYGAAVAWVEDSCLRDLIRLLKRGATVSQADLADEWFEYHEERGRDRAEAIRKLVTWFLDHRENPAEQREQILEEIEALAALPRNVVVRVLEEVSRG